MFVEIQCPPQGGEGALRTVVAFADAATGADRCGRSIRVTRQVESFRVDEPVRVAKFAAQPDREGLTGLTIPGGPELNGAGHPQVVAAVGHLGDLHQDLPRVGKRFVDVPQRAGAAAGGEVKAGGRLTF